MAAPTTAACVKKTLANPEPSTHGPQEPIPTGHEPCPLIEVHRPSARQTAKRWALTLLTRCGLATRKDDAARQVPSTRGTGLMECLFRLDVARLDHLAPLFGFIGDELAEVGR